MRSSRRAGRSGNGACPLISSIAAPPCGCSRRTRSTRPGRAAMSDDFELLRDSFRRDLRLRNKADRTIGAYIESVDRFIAWARPHGLTSVTQVTRKHVRAWLEELLDTVSAQTTVRHHSGAKQGFKWLAAEEEVMSNPFDGIPQPAVPEKLTDVPSVDDVRAVLKVCSGRTFEDRRDHALHMLLADGGTRAAETIGLLVADVDLNDGVIIVMGKGRRPRGVPIGHKAVASLDRYLPSPVEAQGRPASRTVARLSRTAHRLRCPADPDPPLRPGRRAPAPCAA